MMGELNLPRSTAGAHASPPPDELEDLLALYAARRLAPCYGAIPRIRAAVFAHMEAGGPVFLDRAAARRARFGRRLVALGLAATMTVGGAATVMAAGPDSPFYGARIWLEIMTLPAATADRSEAHRQRLETRLQEAQAAAANGNAAAVAQAIAAYGAEVDAALADVGDDADQLARLEAALGTHLAVLEALSDEVPSQAAGAIEAAKDANDRAVDTIKEKKARPEPQGPTDRPGPRGRP